MKVVSMSVYKELKLNKKFQDRIKQEKVRKDIESAEIAMSYMDEYELEDFASIMYDGDKDEAKKIINNLVLKGRMLLLHEENLCGVNC